MSKEVERLRRWQASRITISQSQNCCKSNFDSQWSYMSTSSRKAIPLPFQQLKRLLELKFNYSSPRGDKFSTQDIELNGDLIGVKAAMGVLRPYELCVGIELPSLNATNPRARDISREVDQEAVALNHKKWQELMEELSRPVDESRNGGVGSNGDAVADKSTVVDNNLSLLPGLDLASWGDRRISLLATPKPKLRPLVIFGPRGGTRSCTLTPCVGDNDAAASPSLSPSEIAAELSEMKRSPTPPLSLSFSSESTDSSPKSIAASPSPSPSPDFVFPSLTTRPVPRKIHLEKDDQGFFIGFEDDHYHHSIDTSGLLPPFLIEETSKRKVNQSKTRSIVDRLKRRISSEEISHPLPRSRSQSQSQSQSSSQTSIVGEGDRWIGLGFGEPYQPDHSRAEKKRELFLATKKQQHESDGNSHHQKPKKKDGTPAAAVTRSSRPTIPAPSNPNNPNNDGWIEFKQPPQQPPRQPTTRSRSQNKRHSHSNSSVSHAPSQLPPPPQTAPAAYTAFRPPPLPSHPQPQLQPQPQPQLQLQPQPHHPQAYYYPYSYPQQYAAAYSQVQPQPQPHPYATTYPMALPTVPMAPVAVPVPVPGTLMPGTTVAKHPGYPGFMNRPPIVGYPGAW